MQKPLLASLLPCSILALMIKQHQNLKWKQVLIVKLKAILQLFPCVCLLSASELSRVILIGLVCSTVLQMYL